MLTSVLLTGVLSSSSSHNFAVYTKPIENSTFNSSQGSKEELYQDIYITLLMPYIDKAINSFYEKYFTYLPGADPYFVNILSIERPNGYRTYFFILKLEVLPYIGPHISVGRDQITIEIKYGSKPKVIKFEHDESYPLPPNYQIYAKKWPPQ